MKTIPMKRDKLGLPLVDIVLDHKASPEDVLDAVNQALKNKGILLEFVQQDAGMCDYLVDLQGA